VKIVYKAAALSALISNSKVEMDSILSLFDSEPVEFLPRSWPRLVFATLDVCRIWLQFQVCTILYSVCATPSSQSHDDLELKEPENDFINVI